jgi:hypothetical protein
MKKMKLNAEERRPREARNQNKHAQRTRSSHPEAFLLLSLEIAVEGPEGLAEAPKQQIFLNELVDVLHVRHRTPRTLRLTGDGKREPASNYFDSARRVSSSDGHFSHLQLADNWQRRPAETRQHRHPQETATIASGARSQSDSRASRTPRVWQPLSPFKSAP